MNFKRILLLSCLMNTFFLTYSQIGLGIHYLKEQIDEVNTASTTVNADLASYQFSVLYELRLKNYRIHFLPGLDLSKANGLDINNSTIEQYSYGLSVPVRAYVLSLEGDCDCPTFSQSSNFFSRGFFFEFYPAIRNFSSKTEDAENEELSYLMGIGLGLDIGISDQWTITLFGRTGWIFDQSIGHELSPFESDESSSSFNNAGIELKYYFN